MNMMTDAEYVATGGAKCPHCRSENITAGDRQFEGREAWLNVACDDCGERWVEIFKLQGWVSG